MLIVYRVLSFMHRITLFAVVEMLSWLLDHARLLHVHLLATHCDRFDHGSNDREHDEARASNLATIYYDVTLRRRIPR